MVKMRSTLLLLTSKDFKKVLSKRTISTSGFSLIELVVVIAVLAVLIAIALPNFLGVQRDAKVSTAKNTLTNLVKECAVKESRGSQPTMEGIATATTDLNGYTITGTAAAPNIWSTFAAATNTTQGAPLNVLASSTGAAPAAAASCYGAIAKADTGSQLGSYAIFYDAGTGRVIKRCTIQTGEYAEGCFTNPSLAIVVTPGAITQGYW